MSITGMILMWVFLVAVFALFNLWPMGKELDRRQAYWARYKSK
ncbi:MAG TPA: hypothetical protein VGJ93_01895 [Desulfuromonadaceae bacterium]|jgi:hypothetical protein